jgi:transcriptional regulator with XRE-family HTH domain
MDILLFTAEEIRLIREYMGLSRRLFAPKISISEGYLEKIERGVAPLTMKVIQRIYSAFYYNAEDYRAIIAAMKLRKFGADIDPINLTLE